MKQNRETGEGGQKVDPSTWRRAFVKRLELQSPEEQLIIGHLGGRVKFQHRGYYTLKAVYTYCRGSYLFRKFNVVFLFLKLNLLFKCFIKVFIVSRRFYLFLLIYVYVSSYTF